MSEKPLHLVSDISDDEESSTKPIRLCEFPYVPDGAAVLDHHWRNLPEFWDGDFSCLRLQLVTPGYAGRAFDALRAEENNLTANAIHRLLKMPLPDSWDRRLLVLLGTHYIDRKTSQEFVLGINNLHNARSLYRLQASSQVSDRTYAIVFRD